MSVLYKKLNAFFFNSGSHLLSRAVSSKVPSAAWVLTIVFGMGTGVTPRRIATGNIQLSVVSPHLPTAILRFRFASSQESQYALCNLSHPAIRELHSRMTSCSRLRRLLIDNSTVTILY